MLDDLENAGIPGAKIIKVDRNNPKRYALEPAARAARDGHLVVLPTDTVYGIGTNALLPNSASDIFAAKERPADKPLILLIAEPDDVSRCVTQVNDVARRLMELFWPGSLTLIFKKADVIPDEVTAGGDTVGVRCPNDDIARNLIRMAGVALATTSANVAGSPSPTTIEEVNRGLLSKVSYIIDGGKTELGLESTVVDVSWGEPAIVREGALSWSEIVASL